MSHGEFRKRVCSLKYLSKQQVLAGDEELVAACLRPVWGPRTWGDADEPGAVGGHVGPSISTEDRALCSGASSGSRESCRRGRSRSSASRVREGEPGLWGPGPRDTRSPTLDSEDTGRLRRSLPPDRRRGRRTLLPRAQARQKKRVSESYVKWY